MAIDVIVFITIALSIAPGIICHPQCLDFRPPFESRQNTFCREYADFGCCTMDDDYLILKQHHRVLTDLQNKHGLYGCDELVRRVLCLRCNPYAAHSYDAEDTGIARAFPGLCGDFCGLFYDNCKQAVSMFTSDTNTLISTESKMLFCEHNASPDPDYCYPDLLTNPVLKYNISREGVSVDGCICLEEFAKNLRNPLIMRVPPDETHRMFIGEQKGVVYIYNQYDKTRLDEPFMNLSHIVHVSSRAGDEKGFLGLAFHPRYSQNRRLFVYYSIQHNNGRHRTRLSEFKADPRNPDVVEDGSERVLLEVPQPYDNHNGGEVLFGVDGYLYLFLGDGGAGGDPHGYAQNLTSLLGKVIRLDVDSTPSQSTSAYAIPLANPFVNVPGVRPEIFAYGIRNIWRCDVDEGDPNTGYGYGRIICGDVGQNKFEEIDLIIKGGNYGWNAREGFECYKDSLCDKIGDEELPIHAYPHSVGKSVTGGHVYRGCLNPNWQGKYFFGDFVKGKLFTLDEDIRTGKWTGKEINTCGPDVCFNGLTGTYERNILSFGEDADGEIYMLTTSYASSTARSGKVYKLMDPRRRGDPTKCRTYKPPPYETLEPTSLTSSTLNDRTSRRLSSSESQRSNQSQRGQRRRQRKKSRRTQRRRLSQQERTNRRRERRLRHDRTNT